jgi:hypothetical protein
VVRFKSGSRSSGTKSQCRGGRESVRRESVRLPRVVVVGNGGRWRDLQVSEGIRGSTKMEKIEMGYAVFLFLFVFV